MPRGPRIKEAEPHPLEKWLPRDLALRAALLRLEEELDDDRETTLEERLDSADREASAGLTYGPVEATEFREFFEKWQALYGAKTANRNPHNARPRPTGIKNKTPK